MDEDSFNRWIPAYPGNLTSGDKVRVMLDAFTSEAGRQIHNGRIGVVLAVKDGEIIIKTQDNRTPRLAEARYPYYKLEKAV